jgi:hypothetical protein
MNNRGNERAELDAFLKRLSVLDGFKFSSIVHKDKPDFRITMPDGKIIGVETTRFNCEEQVRAQKLHSSEFPHSWGNLTGLKNHRPRRPNDQIIKSVSKHPTDPTIRWVKTSETMLGWNDRVAAILKRKRLKYNQPGFEIFDENWLLIHQYPPSQIDVYTWFLARQCLKEIFSKPKNEERDFDTVTIHSGDYLFRWHKQGLSAWFKNKLVG